MPDNKPIKLIDFIEEACELLSKSTTIYKVRIEGTVTSVVINKNDEEYDKSGIKREDLPKA